MKTRFKLSGKGNIMQSTCVETDKTFITVFGMPYIVSASAFTVTNT